MAREDEREQGHKTAYQANARYSIADIRQAIGELEKFGEDRRSQSNRLYHNDHNHRGAYFSGLADAYQGAADYLRGRFGSEG